MPRERSRSRRSRSRSRARSRRSRSRSESDESARGRSQRRSPDRRVRSRSRSGTPVLRRSVSRELYREQPQLQPQLQPQPDIQKIVASQQEFVLELIREHKAEVDEKLASKSRRFSSKQIEKQFQVNYNFKELTAKIQQAHAVKDWETAQETADHLAEQLEQHEQDLVIADSSPHGWLAVNKLRNSTELPKAVRKKLAAVEKELDNRKSKNGGARGKFKQFSSGGQADNAGKGRKYSPEEALFYAAKQIRPGQCSHCNKEYHFYRECPSFWTKVQESRAAKAKGSAAATTTN
jgi:hypothetical protein